MKDFGSKMAELKRLEAETLAEAKAEVGAMVAEVRGKSPSTFFVMKFSDTEDGDWSAERYVPSAQARALEKRSGQADDRGHSLRREAHPV